MSVPPEQDDVGEIGDILGFHIRLAHGAVYRHFTESFTDLGLTQKQVSALWLVDDHPGIAQTDLARRLRMDRATTMAIVNRLEARDYLARRPAPDDGRKQALFISATGTAVLTQAKSAIRAHENWLKSRFTPQEVEVLIGFLTRIHKADIDSR